jgi:hypothetical protein
VAWAALGGRSASGGPPGGKGECGSCKFEYVKEFKVGDIQVGDIQIVGIQIGDIQIGDIQIVGIQIGEMYGRN